MSKTRPCSLCKIRPRENMVTGADLCGVCYEYAGWENTHSDDDHDGLADGHGNDSPVAIDKINDEMIICPICKGVPAPWTTEEPKMKTATAPKSRRNPTTRHMSHASCSHPRTPAGRAACRKGIRTALAPERTFPTSKMGKGTAVHLVLVPSEGVVSPLCSGGKKVIVTDPIQHVISAVTCKNCLKLHK